MTEEPHRCSFVRASRGMNYCFWAKLIVAIPAIPILAILAASFFTNPAWQFTVAAYSGALIVILAQRLDHLRLLSTMVRKKRGTPAVK